MRVGVLAGKTILIAEDEYLLAGFLVAVIEAAGGLVRGPFATADAALMCIADDAECPDAAALDIRLLDGESYPVADALKCLGIPFAFASANGAESIPQRFRSSPVLEKPFTAYQAVQTLVMLVQDGEH